MINLNTYCWNDKLNQQKQQSIHKNLPHGRVTIVHKTCYEVISEEGLYQCELTGNMMYGRSHFDFPCTGDWVIFQPFEANKGYILDMLPRERTLYRKKSGETTDKQAIASHIDKAFIVQSLDYNFNVRRVERFMAQIVEENITPVLILNKADLNFDGDNVRESIKHLATKMPIYYTSIHNSESVSILRKSISEGETVIFVGSSGVGKSSLINALTDQQILETSEISISTGKGRHTSTRREMILMEGSGVLIDTPGVREFGLAISRSDSLLETLQFSDYVGSCRFKDCTHTNEPGCAVLEALKSGVIDRAVYESYLKLQKEVEHFNTSEVERRRKGKSLAKLIKDVKKQKGIS